MASTQALGAAALDRKARLAQLKSLKRKQPDSTDEAPQQQQDDENAAPQPQSPSNGTEEADVTSKYLSGRNYDPATRGAKLGFELAPSDGKSTLELQAEKLAAETKRAAEEEAAKDAPLDLFKLQPKKPNWDLKRDLDRKLDVLNVRTDNAIARLVRERIGAQQAAAKARLGNSAGEGEEAVGIEGTTLVEAVNVREREDEEELRREREEEEALLDGS